VLQNGNACFHGLKCPPAACRKRLQALQCPSVLGRWRFHRLQAVPLAGRRAISAAEAGGGAQPRVISGRKCAWDTARALHSVAARHEPHNPFSPNIHCGSQKDCDCHRMHEMNLLEVQPERGLRRTGSQTSERGRTWQTSRAEGPSRGRAPPGPRPGRRVRESAPSPAPPGTAKPVRATPRSLHSLVRAGAAAFDHLNSAAR
jgi:hypothetical protein